jgi:hypothetical protein
MKKLLLGLGVAASAVGTLVALPGTAQAARPTWASSGVAGVQASGEYSRTGNSVHIYGRLYDTEADKRWVGLFICFSGEEDCRPIIKNTNGANTSVPVDLKSTHAPHAYVTEQTVTSNGVKTISGKVKIY